MTYSSPDVYVEEIPSFPPSVAEVGTAIPAFIGYTERATKNTADDLILKPTKVYSLKDFESLYGFPEEDTIAVTVTGTHGWRWIIGEAGLPRRRPYSLWSIVAMLSLPLMVKHPEWAGHSYAVKEV